MISIKFTINILSITVFSITNLCHYPKVSAASSSIAVCPTGSRIKSFGMKKKNYPLEVALVGQLVGCREKQSCELGEAMMNNELISYEYMKRDMKVLCKLDKDGSVIDGVVERTRDIFVKESNNEKETTGKKKEIVENIDGKSEEEIKKQVISEDYLDGFVGDETIDERMGGESHERVEEDTEWIKMMGSEGEEWDVRNKRLQFQKASLVLFANHYKLLLEDLNTFHMLKLKTLLEHALLRKALVSFSCSNKMVRKEKQKEKKNDNALVSEWVRLWAKGYATMQKIRETTRQKKSLRFMMEHISTLGCSMTNSSVYHETEKCGGE